MSDQAFTLSPHDVRAQEFGRVAMRGYDPVQVHEFRERVAGELERLWRERAGLDARVQALEEQLKSFRERERAMNEALLAAQQLRVAAQEQADKDRDVVLQQARADAERLLDGARREEKNVNERTAMAIRQFTAYVTGFRRLLERQLAELEMIEAYADATKAPGRAAGAPAAPGDGEAVGGA